MSSWIDESISTEMNNAESVGRRRSTSKVKNYDSYCTMIYTYSTAIWVQNEQRRLVAAGKEVTGRKWKIHTSMKPASSTYLIAIVQSEKKRSFFGNKYMYVYIQ